MMSSAWTSRSLSLLQQHSKCLRAVCSYSSSSYFFSSIMGVLVMDAPSRTAAAPSTSSSTSDKFVTIYPPPPPPAAAAAAGPSATQAQITYRTQEPQRTTTIITSPPIRNWPFILIDRASSSGPATTITTTNTSLSTTSTITRTSCDQHHDDDPLRCSPVLWSNSSSLCLLSPAACPSGGPFYHQHRPSALLTPVTIGSVVGDWSTTTSTTTTTSSPPSSSEEQQEEFCLPFLNSAPIPRRSEHENNHNHNIDLLRMRSQQRQEEVGVLIEPVVLPPVETVRVREHEVLVVVEQPQQLELMHRNARRPKRANHGARPCSSVGRRQRRKMYGNPKRRLR